LGPAAIADVKRGSASIQFVLYRLSFFKLGEADPLHGRAMEEHLFRITGDDPESVVRQLDNGAYSQY